MKIYTSYFGNAKMLEKNGIKIISVARWQPRFMKSVLKDLSVAPTIWMLKNATHEQYLSEYQRILKNLDIQAFIANLETLSQGSDIALCCYEKPGDFCHRRLLADYITSKTGIDIPEYAEAKAAETEVTKEPSLFDFI